MKNKPSKWGYKVWELTGAFGYIQGYQIYGDVFFSDSQVLDEIGKSCQVEVELSKHLLSGTYL